MYNFRKLKYSDVFVVSKMLNKIDAIKTMKNFFEKSGNTDDKKELGKMLVTELAELAIEKMHLIEDDVAEFLSSVAQIEREQFDEMALEEVIELVIAFKESEQFDSFFKSVFQLTSKVSK